MTDPPGRLGVPAVAGGLLQIAAVAAPLLWPAQELVAGRVVVTRPTLYTLYAVQYALAVALFAFAMGELQKLHETRQQGLGWKGRLGTGLGYAAAVTFVLANLAILLGPRLRLPFNPGIPYAMALLLLVIGLWFLGEGVRRSRLLGPWRFLPLAVGILGFASMAVPERPFHDVTAIGFGVGWAALGLVLWRASEPGRTGGAHPDATNRSAGRPR